MNFHDILIYWDAPVCFPIEGPWDAPLSYFRELFFYWLIYIFFIGKSQDSLEQLMEIYKKSNRNV